MSLREGKKVWEAREGMFCFDCPGCGYGHCWYTKDGPVVNGVQQNWSFNGDLDSPTISPSLDVLRDDPSRRCHSFIKDGMIQFLSDCAHSLRGQTVPIPNLID